MTFAASFEFHHLHVPRELHSKINGLLFNKIVDHAESQFSVVHRRDYFECSLCHVNRNTSARAMCESQTSNLIVAGHIIH